MQENEIIANIGSMVIACDDHFGTYTGIIEEVKTTRIGIIARVKIIDNLVYPKQHSIFYPENKLEILPYKKDTVKPFELTKVSLFRFKITERDELHECY